MKKETKKIPLVSEFDKGYLFACLVILVIQFLFHESISVPIGCIIGIGLGVIFVGIYNWRIE